MNEETKQKGDGLDPTVQVVDVGAVVQVTDEVAVHGVAFIRPGMTPFRLTLDMDPDSGEPRGYSFEPITPRDETVERIALNRVQPKPPALLVPKYNGKLILPE